VEDYMNADVASARLLLFSGIAAGFIFCAVSTVEMFRRPGFDLSRQAISMLSLGEGGWIMKTAFIASGVLTLICAAGIYAKLAPAWTGVAAALLIGCYGLGLVIAGVFDAPAGLGFPPGVPADQQPVMTPGAIVHSIGFMVAFSGLILACFVFAYQFFAAGQTLMAAASLLAGIAMPVLVGLGMSMTMAPGVAFYAAAMAGWVWLMAALYAASAAG
jgi:hypothetical protein